MLTASIGAVVDNTALKFEISDLLGFPCAFSTGTFRVQTPAFEAHSKY